MTCYNSEMRDFINDLAKRFGATKVVMFGSRARGDNKDNSDYDIVFFGVPEVKRAEVWYALEWESPTLAKVDVLFWENLSGVIKDNIEKEGVVIYEAKN